MLKNLFFTGIISVLLLTPGKLFAAPSFVGGLTQTLTICENSGPVDISSYLSVNDPASGSTETWSVLAPPSNGTLVGAFPYTRTSTGSTLTIGPGITYTPAHGFSGTDAITITISDGVSALQFTTINITINPLPTPAPITGLPVVCPGDVVTLSDAIHGGTWGAINSNASVDVSGNVTGVSAGFDTILYSLSNSCGSTIDSFIIDVSSTPYVAPITGPNNACPGLVILTLADMSSGGSWSVTNGNCTIAIGSGALTTVTPGVDTINYSVILSCGVATASLTFTVNPLPDPGVISGPTTVCVGSTITLTDPAPGGAPAGAPWHQDFATTAYGSLNPSTGVITGLAAGVVSVYYDDTAGGCGAEQAYYTVTVNPAPASGSISGPVSVCAGSSIALAESDTGGVWSVSNANATIGTAGVVHGVTGGVDTVSYTVTTPTCGNSTAIYIDTIHALAVAGAISGPVTVCEGATITLADPTAAPAGVWTVKDTLATISAGGVVTGVRQGLDTVVYTISNVCDTVKTTYALTVNPLPHAGVITGPKFVCAGTYDTIRLADTIRGGVWISASTHAWAGNGVSDTGLVTGLSGGITTIYYRYTNFCGSDTARYIDTVKVLPDSGYVTGPTVVCVGATITTHDTTSGGIWAVTNSAGTVSAAGVFSGAATGIDTIKYTVTNVCGSTSARYPVTVVTLPNPGVITGDTAICPDVFTALSESVPGGAWSIINGHALLDASGVLSGTLTTGRDTAIYTVTNMCGSSKASFGFTILSLGICDRVAVPVVTNATGDVTIYPNPATDELTIRMEDGAFSLFVVTNEIGQVMLHQPLSGKETTVNIHSLAPGLYNVTLSGANGIVTRKMVKE